MDPELDRLLLNLQRAVEEMVAEADYDHDRGHQYIVGKTVYREVEAALGEEGQDMGRRGREVHDGMDIIDSRDVIARIEELKDEREEVERPLEDIENPAVAVARVLAWDDSDEGQEFKRLRALQSECENVTSEWKDGAALIRDSYFEEFAEQEAMDVGFIDPKVSGRWPYNHIDWKAAAEELQQDYSQVEFGDTTYWVRN